MDGKFYTVFDITVDHRLTEQERIELHDVVISKLHEMELEATVEVKDVSEEELLAGLEMDDEAPEL